MKYWFIGFVILIVLIFLYTIFNGTPWGKENFRNESLRYLQDKYGDEMTIESVEYDFDNSSYFKYRYYAVAHLKKNSQIQFQVMKYNRELIDTYYVSHWEYEVKNEIRQHFHQVSSVSFQLRSNPLKDSTKVSGIYPPSYHEIKREMKERDMPELRLWVSVDDDRQEQAMNTMLEIVSFLKEKDYRLSAIRFILNNQTDKKTYYLNGAEMIEVTDLDSMINSLR